MTKIGELSRKLWSLRSCFLILPPGHLLPRVLKVRWSVMWANIGVPSSVVPAEVDLLHMRIGRHAGDAPTTSEWSTIWLPTKLCLILELWWYMVSFANEICFYANVYDCLLLFTMNIALMTQTSTKTFRCFYLKLHHSACIQHSKTSQQKLCRVSLTVYMCYELFHYMQLDNFEVSIYIYITE